MRKLTTALVLTIAVAVLAGAASALPKVGQRFTGTTSAKRINGFDDAITFVAGRKSVKGLSFGTLGCFGYSQFPAGVDPYGISLVQLTTSVPMAPKGTFAITKTVPRWAGGDSNTTLYVTIVGKFTSNTSASGTITLSEKISNGGDCGPVKMTFTAKPGGR